MLNWIEEQGSLTKRLRGIYGDSFGIKLLYQCWKPAFVDECNILMIRPDQFHLVREVLLYANAKPLIIARTILPSSTVKTSNGKLSKLGNRPLGEVIFANPNMKCRSRETIELTPTIWSTELKKEIDINQSVWGRRSLYNIKDNNLLVAEFFLPDFILNTHL